MGLITKEVEIILRNNIKYYEDLGYNIPRYKDKQGRLKVKKNTSIKVKVKDLCNGSNVLIDVECDNCNKIIKNSKWKNYLKCVKEDGRYYCQECSNKIFIPEKTNKTKLKNGKSFEQWCIENNRQDVLNRWDYELNILKPNEILYASNKKYYFKCPRNIHQSELKKIDHFTKGQEGSIKCNKCNSFAQWGIDNLGEDFLERYWDYKKNIVNPWEIAKGYKKIVWIKCQEKVYHGSYDIQCQTFIRGCRCRYCSNWHGEVHLLDSLGYLYPQVLDIWSNRNKKSPYEYTPFSNQTVLWKCPEGIHKEFPRQINNSNYLNFRCPECNYSKGEEKISNYLIDLGFIKIDQEDYKLLDNVFKEKNIYYIPQKKFDGLIGTGNGLLSYDFYLPNLQYNLLIEFQGMQHEKYCKGFHKSKKDFLKQIEHDKRKKEYALNHNINLLEIWYWDFDNIESILSKELNLTNLPIPTNISEVVAI